MSNKLEPQTYVHGSKLYRKAEKSSDLRALLPLYDNWRAASLAIAGRSDEEIAALVTLLNAYKDAVEPVLDARPNSAQEVLQPSILEEFFEYLFCHLDAEFELELLRRPESGFIDLAFNPRSLHDLVSCPAYTIRRKDHDFVIGSSLELTMTVPGADQSQNDIIVVPAVAIECKRYLERNMLDECSGTADKVKKATPYCLYFVVAEFLKMDDAAPEMSRIDEIYVLRKQRNSERSALNFTPKPIDAALVIDIYRQVQRHLSRVWWNPQSALTTGKAFNVPR
ncbi:Bpu10I family restriction endonuclease [Azohydromonas lata]|uniref:Bpu10I family restriction endonuclease n=1 Tax=Azohydromonas lata TaxID=45677 RepID=A0ABU5IGF9_9BURK|nr:Bpu10I family restriction endonuclease [Azohydromonas lata]MDZ5458018.1 Bpu10I family restriction endonuclease [Azohydromonas lata]